MTPVTDTTAPDTSDTAEAPVLIRHTDDGRRVEVIGRFVCMDGRREVERKYCTDVIAPRLIDLFREVAGQAESAREGALPATRNHFQ